jgi:hypothetical protein
MPIVFSEHARIRLRKRKISQKLARDIVENPQEIIRSFKQRRLRRTMIGGRILQIVTVTEGSKITIISGYYLRRK